MSLGRSLALLAGFCSVLLVACSGAFTSGEGGATEAHQIEIEDKIVSVFENSTTVIQYAFIANINDGRGYTAGRSGFTSGTGDMLEVVKEYQARVPDNVLARFLAALQKVNGSNSVEGLEGIDKAWPAAATDVKFIAAQDAVNDRLYRKPARKLAAKLGLRLPFSKLAIYEAGIQHGHGEDYDSVNKIAERATTAAGGAPSSGLDERRWLREFLSERRNDLLHPADRATEAGWAASVSRADAIQSIYDSGNFKLESPITITVYGDTFTF
jgi:chitosanase